MEHSRLAVLKIFWVLFEFVFCIWALECARVERLIVVEKLSFMGN